MTKYNGNRALQILAENWDSGDSWGSTLDALGACCDFLATIGEGWRIPADAGYIAAGVPEIDWLIDSAVTYAATGVAEDWEWNSDILEMASSYYLDADSPITLDGVEQAAIILNRWANVLKAAGKDY